mmetsp:Transcript_952/g.1664  ORF Transcript_952/g.1664 Transcript_952/m.1664 type:complete len:144 (+) Transcript_952:161-592(+)
MDTIDGTGTGESSRWQIIIPNEDLLKVPKTGTDDFVVVYGDLKCNPTNANELDEFFYQYLGKVKSFHLQRLVASQSFLQQTRLSSLAHFCKYLRDHSKGFSLLGLKTYFCEESDALRPSCGKLLFVWDVWYRLDSSECLEKMW